MRELEWPFDEGYIMAKRKRLRRQLLEAGTGFVDTKIAILGGSTTNDVKLILELFLLNYGIRPTFYESEYDQYYQDAVFGNPSLDAFAPDIIYIHTTNRNIIRWPEIGQSPAEVAELEEAEYARFERMWQSLAERHGCPVIQNNFELPAWRLMGNMDASDIHGRVHFVSGLNMRFYAYAQQHQKFYINDINYLAADYGLEKWAEPFYWYMYKYALSVPAIPRLSFSIANIVKSILGKNKKGFVLDLDNTLWGGVVGDDGVDGLELGPEEPRGQVYTEFQQYIKAHKELGVLLNVDSKNEYENAIAGLNHPNGVLRPEDFIVIKANWEPKDQNFTAIAQTLELLPESLVFVDDNPAERAIVQGQVPGAAVPEMGRPEDYIRVLDRAGYFEVTSLSEDDRKRNAMYRENTQRAALQKAFTDYGDYLRSLEMTAEIRPFEALYMARIAQLSNKSNQFNLTTRRYTQAEIEHVAADADYITLYGKLQDKFGDNGLVAVTIGRQQQDELHIELWLMSCRVLRRDMEFAMMDALVARAAARGVRTIWGYYLPTAKNKMVQDFYGLQGFEKVEEDEAGNAKWRLDISQGYTPKNKYIEVEA